MKKVVYVTGCLGFIGSYVTRACLSLGWYVKGVDKMTYAANRDLLTEFKKNPNFFFFKQTPTKDRVNQNNSFLLKEIHSVYDSFCSVLLFHFCLW